MRTATAGILMAAFLATSCSVFIVRGDIEHLKELEKGTYVLRKDFDVEGKVLKKGETVKLKITSSKEWVKVHAYPARLDELKAERVLILYLFDDDFEGKKYSRDHFMGRLEAVAAAR